MKAAVIAVGLLLAGCGAGDNNMGAVMADADACAEQRTNELYSRVAAQDVPDEQLRQIVNECLAEAKVRHEQ